MKWLAMPAIILAAWGIDPSLISRINSAKTVAKKAFLANDYPTAIAQYKYLVDSLGVTEDEVIINLAHCYFNQNDTASAMTAYQKLITSSNKLLKSNAYQQLGVLNNRQNRLEEALTNFKESIKADPANEESRYNYEMVKKKLEQKRKQEQNNKNQSPEPSEFAKQLKAKADKLVFEKRYTEAHTLMQDGLKKDRTVSFYQDFINRTKIVSDINQKP
jgi:tetratricopeptide (TPR) repeat protein